MKGDIQSLDLVLHLLASEEVDTVMHFAAQVPLRDDPAALPSAHIPLPAWQIAVGSLRQVFKAASDWRTFCGAPTACMH